MSWCSLNVLHRLAVRVGRFVVLKSRRVPDRYVEHALFCSAVANQVFATKAKTTPKPNTTPHVHWLQKGHPVLCGTSGKHSGNWKLEQEDFAVHVLREACS